MLLAATAARAFDFRATAPSGQWLYYTIVDEGCVKVVNPDWDTRTPPSGVLRIPATATNIDNNTSYQVIAIDAEAFKRCDGLTTVILTEGIASIGRMAFAFCSALDSVALPSTITYIGSQAFTGTSFFSSSHLNDEGLLIADGYLIGARTSITGTITVPAGVQGLGNMAFYSCGLMERVILPEGLRFIGENAFQDCMALDTVEIHEATPPALEANAFTNVYDFAILVPCHSASTYREAEAWSSLSIVEHCLPDDPSGIEEAETQLFAATAIDGGIRLILPEGCQGAICDILGRRIATAASGESMVPLSMHGVYIVHVEGMGSKKVLY